MAEQTGNVKDEQLAVIGAGFGRTATESLKKALDILGYKCYHMHELFKHKDDDIWCKILDTPKEKRNWNESLFAIRGYTATVDWPTTAFYEDLMKENPSAKVVLTVRDTPEAWYKSTRNSIYALNKAADCWQHDLLALFVPMLQKRKKVLDIIWKDLFDGIRFEDEDFAIDIYKKHTEEVKSTVPSDKLLIFNVKQGWEPLCKFLEKDVPKDLDFPRGNSTQEKIKKLKDIKKMKRVVTAITSVAAISAAVIGGVMYKYYKRKNNQ